MYVQVCGLGRRRHDFKTTYHLFFSVEIMLSVLSVALKFSKNPVSVLSSKLLTVVFLYSRL